MKRFEEIPPYGGSTLTHKRCSLCREFIPLYRDHCVCEPKEKYPYEEETK